MIMTKSEKLQYVGTKCMQSLALENAFYQEALLDENGAEHLMRLLKQHSDKASSTSDRVVLAVVEAIASLCIDIAHVSNERAQNELCERGALQLLFDLFDRQQAEAASNQQVSKMNRCILIETAYAIACLILHRDTDETVEQRLNFRNIVDLIDQDNLVRPTKSHE